MVGCDNDQDMKGPGKLGAFAHVYGVQYVTAREMVAVFSIGVQVVLVGSDNRVFCTCSLGIHVSFHGWQGMKRTSTTFLNREGMVYHSGAPGISSSLLLSKDTANTTLLLVMRFLFMAFVFC